MNSKTVFCLLIFFSFCHAPAPAASQSNTFSQSQFRDLVARLDEIRKKAGVAGGALLVTGPDQMIGAAGFGVDDWEKRQPITLDRYVRIGSVTKAFTSLAFLKLQEQGQLKLSDRFTDLAGSPRYQNPWSETRPVTLAQLLEHTAGLADMSPAEWQNKQPHSLPDALALDPSSRRLHWPPGLHSSYSNSGAGLAAYAAETKTGLDFEEYLKSNVFEPLGMTSATLQPSDNALTGLITGYDHDARSVLTYWHMLYRPFGAMNVRIEQMQFFLQMLLANGTLNGKSVFPETAIRRMETPQTTLAARAGLRFGYGLGNYAYVRNGFLFHGHGGDADGYLSFYGYNREAGLGYFLVINAFQNDTLRRMRKRVEAALVNGLSPSFAPGVPQPAASLRLLTGSFEQVTRRFGGPPQGLEVIYDNNRLYLDRFGNLQHLIPLSVTLFRRPFEPVATIAFVEEDGDLYLQGPFGNFRRNSER